MEIPPLQNKETFLTFKGHTSQMQPKKKSDSCASEAISGLAFKVASLKYKKFLSFYFYLDVMFILG